MRIKGWTKFQHFKDRRPPWVKLYRDLLDDPDWSALDGDSAKALVMFWLIASEDETGNGNLPDVRRLAFRLRTTEAKINQALTRLSHWLEQGDISVISDRYHDDINVISPRYQLDTPETEERQIKESDKSQRTEVRDRLRPAVDCPDDCPPDIWSDFVAHRKSVKAPVTQTAVDGIRREAIKAGLSLPDALREICSRGWRGFKAEWMIQQQAKSRKVQPVDDDPEGWVHKSLRKGAQTIEGDAICTPANLLPFGRS
jgi:hypothetical protein